MLVNPSLQSVADAGVSIWLDDLSKGMIESGELERRIAELSVSGVTTNPAIFQKSISDTDEYEQDLKKLAENGVDVDAAIIELTTTDVRNACDVFASTYSATQGVDGRVSIEVDPRLADDAAGTAAAAHALHAKVDRPNVLIKIPATAAGIEVIPQILADGIDINVTLIFGAEQYRKVALAYVEGLEKALEAGRNLNSVHSVASVFVSRFDSAADKVLDSGSADPALRGTAALTNARLCFQIFQEIFTSERFTALAKQGARPQRLLWASTGVKDPAYPATTYVTELVTAGTVNTMPYATMQATAEATITATDTVTPALATVEADRDALAAAGVNLGALGDDLLGAGLESFVSSWSVLIESVQSALSQS